MNSEWRKRCVCPKPPRTTYIILCAIGFMLFGIAAWSIDWAFAKQAAGQDVTLFDWTFSPSGWMNIAWVIMAFSLLLGVASAIKLGWTFKCRGEI